MNLTRNLWHTLPLLAVLAGTLAWSATTWAATTQSNQTSNGPSASGKTERTDGPGDNDNKDKDNKDKSAEKSKSKRVAGFTKEREAAAMTFVRVNHPELAALLEQLKLSDNAEYQRAIRELFVSSEKLAQLQERSPRRYADELELWKLNSRIQLLVARLAMMPEAEAADSPQKNELRQAVEAQVQLRRAQLAADIDRATSRLAELQDEVRKLDRDQATLVDKRISSLLREASRSHGELNKKKDGSKKSGKKDASKKDDDAKKASPGETSSPGASINNEP